MTNSAIPNSATQFKKGNPGKPKGAAPISRRRARKELEQAIRAEAAGKQKPDFEGDALAYAGCVFGRDQRRCYCGCRPRGIAVRYKRPAQAAIALLEIDPLAQLTDEQIDRRFAEPRGRNALTITAAESVDGSWADGASNALAGQPGRSATGCGGGIRLPGHAAASAG